MKYLAMVLTLCICTGCARHYSRTENLPYHKNGVQFTIPAGWKVKSSSGSQISVEKKGMSASALISFSILSSANDKNDALETFLDVFKVNPVYKRARFENVKEDAYGSFSGVSSSFTVRILTLDFEGKLLSFSAGNKTIVVLKQVSIDDVSSTTRDFAIIENSLKIIP